jgi:hypothetical protein
MFGIYLISVGSIALPPRLLDRQWQLAVSAALVDNAIIPLVGLGQLHLAALLDPAGLRLRALRKGAARLAIAAALGFLLLVPVQLHAAWGVFTSARVELQRREQRAGARFDALREAIGAATGAAELRSRLLALQGPSLSSADLGEPLPQLKQRLLASLNQVETGVMRQLEGAGRGPQDGLFRASVRVSLSALALALAFASGARRRGSEVSVLRELGDRWGRRSASPLLRSGRSSPGVDAAYFEQIGGDDDPRPPTP